MHSKVTQEIVDTYDEVGVAHVPGVFSCDWVARMTGLIDSIIKDLRDGSLSFGPGKIFRDVEFEDHDGYVRLINLYWHTPEMRALIEESECAEAVADVIGSDEMRATVDGTFLKEGDKAETATPWHNDDSLSCFRGHHHPSMWVALTDIDRDNAPLKTIAGSNRDTHRYLNCEALGLAEPPPNFHPWSELLERANAPDADVRVWEAAKGDILVIHPRTIHASLPRSTGRVERRLGFSLRWIGSDIRYEKNPSGKTSPFGDSQLLRPGEPIPAEIIPVTWNRDAAGAPG